MAERCSGGVPEVFRRRYLWTSPEVHFFAVFKGNGFGVVEVTDEQLVALVVEAKGAVSAGLVLSPCKHGGRGRGEAPIGIDG
jgi:hypothetical protein